MEVESVLVTGANRGIGLEFVRQLVDLPKPPHYIFATYRNEDTIQELKTIGKAAKQTKVVLIKTDVTKSDDIKAMRKIIKETVGEKGLTFLINNAGVANVLPFPNVTEENMLFHFRTNTVAPVLVFQEVLPLLQKAASHRKGPHKSVSRAIVLNMTSLTGSIENVSQLPPDWLVIAGYGTSKAALNMVMRMAAMVVKNDDILVVNMCPGWVKTEMGSERGEITLSESISTILNTLPRLDESHHGSYINRHGKQIPF